MTTWVGFDDALIGWAERCGSGRVAVYDGEKMVAVLVERDGMDDDEAREYLSYNVLGAWVGEDTPWIVTAVGGLDPQGE